MENKAIELLRQLRSYVNDSSGVGTMTLAYVSPAQAMRNAADEMERKDALLREIDEFLQANANPQA